MPEACTILMVDDDHEIARAACMRLRAAGYTTLQAADGESGVASAVANHPDLILLDVRMPGKDGLAALSDLKHRSDTCGIPVVMLSASVVDQEAGLNAGARFFIRKPYSGATLMQAVRTAIGSPAAPDARGADHCPAPSQTAISSTPIAEERP
jgi:twitching motility two-component system response regulator PilH